MEGYLIESKTKFSGFLNNSERKLSTEMLSLHVEHLANLFVLYQ